MKRTRAIALAAALSLLTIGVVPATAAAASADTELTLHYYRAGSTHAESVTASTVDGKPGAPTATTHTGAWWTTTFTFAGLTEKNATVGFVVADDSAYPDQKRLVRASGSSAQAWVLDGDPQVYRSPEEVDRSLIVQKDDKAYVAVEDLGDLLGLTYKYGKNGYLFDGAATGTVDILTIYRGRDYFEINPHTNRIGSNVTGNMLRNYTDVVFSDVDGFQQDGKYYLSFGYIERLFQVGTLVSDDGAYILPRQYVAYNTIQPAGDVSTVGFSQSGLDAIDDYVKQQADNGGPSLAISIVKDGKLVKDSAYGYAKKYDTPLVNGQYQKAQLLPQDQWQKATPDTLYDLASNTKMYATNYAIQQLVSEGKLDLNRTIQSFPGWENYTDANSEYTGQWTVGGAGGITKKYTGKSTITVADLLHHSAGEIPDPQYQNYSVAGDLYYQSSDIHDRSGIIDAISRTPLIAAPRSKYLYSDVDFMILGLIVEQVTGQTLDAYMADHFYTPLGLTHTTFNPLDHGFAKDQVAATELNGNTRDGNVSFGTLPDGSPVPIRKYTLQGQVHDEKAYYSMGGVSGHAGLFSTSGDMAVLTQLMLNGGIYNGKEYFSKDVADEFTTPYSADPAKVDTSTIGLGWELHSKSAAAYYYFNWGPSRNTYGHEGWTGTLTIIDPTYDMTITILTNMRHSPVINPPNGFEDSNFPIADMVPVSARVYAALTSEKTQYSPVTSVTPVKPVTVQEGTSAADAVAALPATTTITDADGATHSVDLTWKIDGYHGDEPGDYDATATFSLPANVTQSDPPTTLSTSTTVTVARPAATASIDKTMVDAGDTVTVHGSGYQPGETVTAELHSTPVKVGSAVATVDGVVELSATIPADTAAGSHTISLTGDHSGQTATTDPFTVRAAAGGGSGGTTTGANGASGHDAVDSGDGSGAGLADTGSDALPYGALALLLLVAGAGALFARRRAARTTR